MSQPNPNRPPNPVPVPVEPEQGTGTGTPTRSTTASSTPTPTNTQTSQTQTGTPTATTSLSQSQTSATRTQSATTTTTRLPLPPGADQNTPIRVCDQYPLSSIDSLRTSWSQNLVRALERNLTNAAPIFPDPQLVLLVRTAVDNASSDANANNSPPDLALARSRAESQIAAALMPYWGSRSVAGCFRFARFHSDLFFCTDGSVAARSCLVNDKCPALGQALVALAPNRDPETVPGVELRDVPFNIMISSPTLKINNGNTSILIPPPENAAAALIYGCWDVPNTPGTGSTDPLARVYVCQVERGEVATPENDPAPWIRQAAPKIPCPVPFLGAAPPAVSPTTPISQPGVGTNNGLGDNGNSGAMLAVPAIIAIVVGSSILAAAMVALGLFVRSRFRSRRRNRHLHHSSSGHSAGHRDGRRSLFAPPTLSTISTATHHLAPGAHRRGSDDATPRSSFMLMHVSASNAAPLPAALPDTDRIVTTVRWENTVVAGHDARQLLASCTPAPLSPSDADMRHPDGTPMTPTSPAASASVLPYDVAAIRAEWDALFADVSRLINDRMAALDEQHLTKLAVYQTVASQSLGYSAASMDRRTSFAAGDRRSLSAASYSALHAPQSPSPSTLSLQRATTTSPQLRSIAASTASLAGSPISPASSPPMTSSPDHTSTTAHLSALLFQLANVIFAHFLPAHLLSPDKRTTYGTVVATYHPAYAHVRTPARPTVGPKAAFRGMADLTTPGANLALDPVRRAAALRAALGAMVSTTVRDMRRVLAVAGLATPASASGRPLSTPAGPGGGAFSAQAHVADDMALRALVDRLVSLVFRIKAAIPSAVVYFPPLKSMGAVSGVLSPKMGPSDSQGVPRDGGEQVPDHCMVVTRPDAPAAVVAGKGHKAPVARSPTADSARAESPVPLLDEQRASPALTAASGGEEGQGEDAVDEEGKVQFAYWPGVLDDDRKVVVVPARVWID